MKKSIVFPFILLLLAGCSNREPMPENEINETSSETSFLSVSIVASGTTGTRTADEEYPEGGGTYKDGTADENAVTSVLFLFFDNEGNPVEGIYNSQIENYVSYYLWEYKDDDTQNNQHEETVEKMLNGVIKMRFPRRNNTVVKPTQVFTVVNPTNNYMDELVDKTLTELKGIVNDYEAYKDTSLSKKGHFVMTNSVYVDKNDNEICTTAIEEDNYQSTEDLAEKNPVIIYVERILARIDLKIDIKNSTNTDDGATIYYTGVNFRDDAVAGDNNIYVRFLGWNVFDTPNQSRLIKSIDTNWNSDILGQSTPWSVFQYHRSFWAINPPATTAGFEYKRGAFKAKNGENSEEDVKSWVAAANSIPESSDKYVTAYFQENAAPYESDATSNDKTYGDSGASYVKGAPVRPSKVILAAQLVDANGASLTLAKYAGTYYTWEDLKTVLRRIPDLYFLQTSTDSNGNTTKEYTHIKAEHLDYESNGDDKTTVRIVLSQKGKEIDSASWYTGTTAEDMTPLGGNVEDYINEKIGDNSVRVWSEGYTYFYFPIRHLGENETSPGYYGIVRNHIYEATVTSIKGLGTPVLDPDDVIVPTPDEDTGILAAQVRILSWRLVSQNYELNW